MVKGVFAFVRVIQVISPFGTHLGWSSQDNSCHQCSFSPLLIRFLFFKMKCMVFVGSGLTPS